MSAFEELPSKAREAWRLRWLREIVELDLAREVRRLADAGYSRREVGRLLWLDSAQMAAVWDAAEQVSFPLEGFSGALPIEICQRYAVGLLSRERLVDELTRWQYAPSGHTDGYDSLIVDPPGAWDEVVSAHHRGWIDDDIYEDVFNRRHGIGAG